MKKPDALTPGSLTNHQLQIRLRSRWLSWLALRRVAFAIHDPDALFEHIHRDIRLLLVNDQRRTYSNCRRTGSQEQHSALECQIDHAIPLRTRKRFRLLVLHQVYADHQPAPANIADEVILPDPLRRARQDVISNARSVPNRVALQHVHRRQRRRDRYWVPAKS